MSRSCPSGCTHIHISNEHVSHGIHLGNIGHPERVVLYKSEREIRTCARLFAFLRGVKHGSRSHARPPEKSHENGKVTVCTVG